eukprot:55572-Chlamydomonas_euryale.AAC.1
MQLPHRLASGIAPFRRRLGELSATPLDDYVFRPHAKRSTLSRSVERAPEDGWEGYKRGGGEEGWS